ncbi:hypothetical protein OSB04_021841 [Centaurea solstitialis]|uniref:Trichome birefringence-like C-terminal domain-containing protein n=1 Tax=Centaurea solstitialis TaxID=347529 RepID=A0AA38SV84_9ASTR|nr:hypothetical protein OSB04_021841 [Centaurea solstitialis]
MIDFLNKSSGEAEGKRVIFVGDSVNRNQWISMVCMLQTVIPTGQKKMQKVVDISLFTFKAFVSSHPSFSTSN